MIAICFAVIAVFEWRQCKDKPSGGQKAFWWFFSLMLVWNLAANFIPWWPNPIRLIMYLLGWM
ncbi:hypothetical protein [Paenibacillus lutrae]|uniref:Uncharacterized protein n=1 Tax=Paenibacillus lutrae TaxID=2078573 RepID=A0A7X3JXY8_9BACL|nr:hypothetical protein [Paenibacillus lutrae]MVO98355.1 hypothetical protein [Paenibacillus lutrae]